MLLSHGRFLYIISFTIIIRYSTKTKMWEILMSHSPSGCYETIAFVTHAGCIARAFSRVCLSVSLKGKWLEL